MNHQKDKNRYSLKLFRWSGMVEKDAPLHLLLIMVASIILAELFIHQLLSAFPSLTRLQETLIDNLITIGVVFPFLYFFSYHPLVRHIRRRREAEESLKQAQQQLEQRVLERTRQLVEVNDSLISEIAAREKVENDLRRRNRELSAFNTISSKISASLQLEEVYATLKNLLVEDLSVPAGAIFTRDDTNQPFAVSIAWGVPEKFAAQAGQQVLAKPQLTEGIRARECFLADLTTMQEEWPEFKSLSVCFCAPIFVREEFVGIVELFGSSPDGFTEEERNLFKSLSTQLSIAIQNARLFGEAQTNRAQLKALSHRLVEVQENERRYIAREIHDETSQALTYLIFALDILRRDAKSPSAVMANVDELEELVQGIMDKLHRLAVDLRPASLDFLGLVPALRQLADIFREQHKIDVTFEAKGFERRLPTRMEISLFRIVQEAAKNAVQKGQATHLAILLEQCEGRVYARIIDNGVGFVPSLVNHNEQLGLIAMRERASALGGSLSIESTEGKGTCILVEVPNGNESNGR